MKKSIIVKTKVVKPFYLSDKTAIIILVILPVLYFLIFTPGLLTGSKMMYGSDWLLGGFPVREVITRQISQFKTIPMWYNFIFSGLPTVTGPYGDVASIYPFVRLVIPTHLFWTYLFVFGIMIAGIGMYLFLKSLDVSNEAALLGGIAYMFAGNLVSTTYAGHEGRLLAAAFFPLAFFFWNKGIISKKYYWFVFAGGITGFSFLHGHFQLTYYGLWVALAYLVFQLIINRKQNGYKNTVKIIVYAGISVVIALGVLAVNYLPFLTNLAYGARGEIRGYEFAASWALPIKELFDLIVPQFSGILDKYWGDNMFKLHTEYFGIILLLFAVVTLFIKFKERRTIFFFSTSIIATLIALGSHTPFFKFVYYVLPGIKRFRGPSMAFYLVAFSIIVIGAIGLQYLLDYNQKKKVFDHQTKRKLRNSFYFITIFFVLFLLIFLISKNNVQSSITNQSKIQAFSNNIASFWSGVTIAAILITICIFIIRQLINPKTKIISIIIILAVLIIVDQWRINKQFLKTVEHPSVYYKADEVINYLTNDTSLYRVHPLYDGMFGLRLQYEHSNDGVLDLYNIQNVGGYCPNPLQTYQDFLGAEKTVMFQAPNLIYTNFLNLLNIKYIISPQLPNDISRYDATTQTAITELRRYLSREGIEPVFSGRKYVIYKNNNTLPRSFFVPNYEVINDKTKIIERLKDVDFDPQKYVIISKLIPDVMINGDSIVGSVKIVSYTPNRIILETEQNNNGFLVLSENFHPDWFCKVDGQLTKVYPAYHTLRAIYITEGKHTVEFYYYSKYYVLGRLITIMTILFCCLVLVITVRKKKVNKIASQPIR